MTTKLRVAVLGINGFLGKPILELLQDASFAQNYQFPIVAITRDISKYQDDDKIIYKQSKTDDELDLILQETDVLINLVGNAADHEKIIDLVIKNKLKLYIPSQFGGEYDKHQSYLPIVPFKITQSQKVSQAGIKNIDIATGAFADLLYNHLLLIGYDHSSNKVTFIGDQNAKFPVTQLKDIAKVVALVVGVYDYTKLPDVIRVCSDRVTPEELVQRYEATHKVKAKREFTSKEEGLAKAQKMLSKGYDPKDFLYYLTVIIAQGPDKGIVFDEDERELINPKEKYFQWTPF